MSVRAIIFVGIVAAPLALAGGYWEGKNAPADPGASLRPPAAPMVAKPGAFAPEAAAYLAKLNVPPPPPGSGGPPPIDVAVLFRRDLSGVINAPGAVPQIIMASAGVLHPGDIYRDGWKLSSVTATTAVLTKGSDTRRIGLFSPPVVTDAQAGPVVSAGTLSLTNGLRQGEISPEKIDAVVARFKAAGASDAMLAQLKMQLQNGQTSLNTLLSLLQQLRPAPSLTQVTQILNAYAAAGLMQAQQVSQTAQQLTTALAQAAANGRGGRGGPGGPGGNIGGANGAPGANGGNNGRGNRGPGGGGGNFAGGGNNGFGGGGNNGFGGGGGGRGNRGGGGPGGGGGGNGRGAGGFGG